MADVFDASTAHKRVARAGAPGDCLQILEGHTDEIFSAAFNYEGDTIITGSKARTRTRHGLTARLKPFLLPLAGQHVPHLEELNGLGAGEKIK